MTDSKIGDIVRFEAQERLDIPDANALQTLVYQAIVDALGGLLGPTSGVLGQLTFDTSSAPVIGIPSATFVGCKSVPGDAGHVQGYVVHYDPTSPVQAASKSINLSAPAATSQLVYLFWGRSMADSDQATRRRWSGGGEATFTPNTRRRQQIVFGYSSSQSIPPTGDRDWFCFGRVVSWAGSVPTIRTFSPWDLGAPAYGSSSPNPYMGRFLSLLNTLPGSSGNASLGGALQALASQVLMLQDSGWQFDNVSSVPVSVGSIEWGTNPPVGVRQLSSRINGLESRGGIIAVVNVSFDGATEEWFLTDPTRDYLADPGFVVSVSTYDGVETAVCSLQMYLSPGFVMTGWDVSLNHAPMSASDVSSATLGENGWKVYRGASAALPVVGPATRTLRVGLRLETPPPGSYRASAPMTFVVYGQRA